jgi:hypothetical protein
MLTLSQFIPVPMRATYRLIDGTKMACVWIHFRGRALAAHHYIR